MQASGSNGTQPGVPGRLDLGAMRLRLQQGQRYLAIAMGFSIPISTALDNMLAGLLLLLWLVSGTLGASLRSIRANPVALAALALFALSLLGLLWNVGPPGDGWTMVRKYSNLLLIPILVTVMTDAQDRRRAWLAFCAALVITLIGSYAIKLGLLPTGGSIITAKPNDPTVFKYRISHNLLMAFACLLFAEMARITSGRGRWVWALLALAAVVNVMLMVKGRTGYVILAGLVLLWIAANLRWKGFVGAIVLVAVGFGVLYQASASFHARMDQTLSEAAQWQPDVATGTSVGQRLEFYHNTLEIVKQHWLLGVGTGGFATAYEAQVAGTKMEPTHNPHNLYLLVLVQFGLLGIVALAVLLVTAWRCASRLPSRMDATLAYGVIITLALGGLFNSLIIDHTESMFFAWGCGVLFGGLRTA
jgi:O-antigen ligase